MITQTSFYRMLYVVTGLTTAVAIILAILAAPPTTLPQTYIAPMWRTVAVHVLIFVALGWTIWMHRRGDDRKEIHYLAGAGLLAMGFMLLDWGIAFHNRPEQPPSVSISLFISVGCDLFIGLLLIMTRYLCGKKPTPK